MSGSAREPRFAAARARALVEKDVEELGPFVVVQACTGLIFGLFRLHNMTLKMYPCTGHCDRHTA